MTATPGHVDTVVLVAVAEITVSAERRTLVRNAVLEQLMISIARRGLLVPVRLRRDKTLVCGLHRLVAVEGLERAEIPAIYCDGSDADIELDELEENLCRKDLTVLERARHEHRQKELYLALNHETARGVAGGRARHGLQPKAPSFAAAQGKAGDGRRMHEQRVQIAEALGADGDRLVDHAVANNHTALLELARLPDAVRSAAVDMLASGEAKTVREIVTNLRGEVRPPSESRNAPRVPVSCPIANEPEGYVATTDVEGRRLRICYGPKLDVCTVEDRGPAPGRRPAPRQDTRPLALANSLAVPDEVIAEFPRDIAGAVRLSPIFVDDHCRCERCGATRVWGEATYICGRCTTGLERGGYGFSQAPTRSIRSPRLLREIAFLGPLRRPWHRQVILWSYGPDVCPDAPAGSVHIEHWSSSLERWRVNIYADGSTSVEKFKAQLREAVLKQLCDLQTIRQVRDRYVREDGREVVLVPGEPMTALSAWVQRSGLAGRRIRDHRLLHQELQRHLSLDVDPREVVPTTEIPRHCDRAAFKQLALYNKIMRRHWETIGEERARRGKRTR
jgi:hypothetical protein